ncbi:MAG: ABC transporter ATP-binding protein [Anaerolineaceae bacterium]|nr:ABC transporter ATP-binding protein [Anaerolineaceae bacterium]
MAEAIAVKEITKRFPGVLANDTVSISVEKGEIRAIVGENGAGKTTLMNMLYGLYQSDSGQIFVKGEVVKIPNARTAIELGIGMVHQHFKLVPSYTLAQNIVLGIEPKKGLLIDEASLIKSVQQISEKYSLAVDVNKVAEDASVGEQQRAEILKALYRGADILILDEPTAVLTDLETEELFVMLRGLASNGKTILFISHKLREVLAISDNTTVMRQGRVVGSVKTSETDSCKLAEMMVGRETIEGRMRMEAPEINDIVLELKKVNVLDSRDFLAVKDVDLQLHSGEVLGIAGVDGNGQEELTEAIMGLRPLVSGEILVNGVNIANRTNRQIRESGVAYIPSDRNRAGVAVEAYVWENLIAGEYYRPPYSGSLNLHTRSINNTAHDLVARYQISTPGIKTQTDNLSGGNVQRLIVGRELGSEKAMVVVASQPTRGIDIAGTEAIRKTLLEYANRGAGVLLISADLDEVLALSDRIVVLYEGKHMDAGPVVDGIRVQVGHLMTGGEGECPV